MAIAGAVDDEAWLGGSAKTAPWIGSWFGRFGAQIIAGDGSFGAAQNCDVVCGAGAPNIGADWWFDVGPIGDEVGASQTDAAADRFLGAGAVGAQSMADDRLFVARQSGDVVAAQTDAAAGGLFSGGWRWSTGDRMLISWFIRVS